jgi:hypothetical protein
METDALFGMHGGGFHSLSVDFNHLPSCKPVPDQPSPQDCAGSDFQKREHHCCSTVRVDDDEPELLSHSIAFNS